MRIRTFTVPFAKVVEAVAPDAHEIEFGPGDFLVVRPLFGLPREEQAGWSERIRSVEEQAEAAKDLPRSDPARVAAEEAADLLVLDTIRAAVLEWHLEGPDGRPIEMPGTPEALNALPGGIAASLYPFLTRYRGESPNPTTPR